MKIKKKIKNLNCQTTFHGRFQDAKEEACAETFATFTKKNKTVILLHTLNINIPSRTEASVHAQSHAGSDASLRWPRVRRLPDSCVGTGRGPRCQLADLLLFLSLLLRLSLSPTFPCSSLNTARRLPSQLLPCRTPVTKRTARL